MKQHAFLLCALLAAAVTHASGQNATFTQQAYPIIGNVHCTADFNGDGKLDIAGPGLGAAVMLNNGNGTFGPKTEFPLINYPQGIAAGDFNGDGKMDLAVSLQNAQFSLAILLGTGTGSFGPATYYPNTNGFDCPYALASDINNDGKVDVLIMRGIDCFGPEPCHGARVVTVMMGNGDGTFQPARDIDVNTFPYSFALGDFNRDGIKDLVVGGPNTQVSISLGVGDGTFRPPTVMDLIPGGDQFSASNDVDVADFNRDGIEDLTVPLGNGYGTVILLGNGDGTFRVFNRIIEDAVSAPQGQAVADYNGDGFLDIARGMADGIPGLFQILHGNGDGTFRPLVRYAKPPTAQGGGFMIAGDFNGDGKPDIALEVRGNSPATDVFLNTTGGVVSPTAPTVSTLTFNPSSVTGGSGSTGTVTLTARAQTAISVAISSNAPAAKVPASVSIAAGAQTASFSITTTQVTTATSAQITATANGTSRVATLAIGAVAPTADTVSVSKAEYDSGKRTLKIEASSSRSTATLQAYVTSSGALIGTLTNNGGKYSGQFNWSTNPQNITVRSNLGGSTSSVVSAK